MKPLTMDQALSLADAFEVTPDVVAQNDKGEGEVSFTVPRLAKRDWDGFLTVVAGGLQVAPESIEIVDDVIEESPTPCVHITIKTEN